MAGQFQHASHLDILRPEKRRKYLDQAVDRLQLRDFDSIVCCGVSGMVFAPLLSMALNKYLTVVRKQSDTLMDRHSMLWVEGYVDTRRYIIVDDLVSSGATVRYIVEQMKKFAPDAELISVYCYIQDTETEGRYYLPYDPNMEVIRQYNENALRAARVEKWGEEN